MATPEQEIFDDAVRHQIGLNRLSTANARQVLAVLRRVDADIMQRLTDAEGLSRQRLERMLEAIRAIIDSAHTDAYGQLVIDLNALSDYELGRTGEVIDNVLQVQTVRPNPQLVWSATFSRPFQGKLLREWFTELSDATFSRVRDAIRIGQVEGQTTAQIVKTLRGSRANGYKDGILDIGKRQAEAVVRTAVNHVATRAKEAVYESNPRVIRGVEWVSILDGRTTAVCRGRSGMVYPVNSGPRPPAHIGCRSTIVPALTNEYSTKGSDTLGRVSADQNYDAWLRTQNVAFQNDVLGKDKATLFRRGGLTLDRFIDRAGHEYTLAELKEREAGAWSKSGL